MSLADAQRIFAGDPNVTLQQETTCEQGIPIVKPGVLIRLPSMFYSDMISMEIGGGVAPNQLVLRQNGQDIGVIPLPNLSGHTIVTIPQDIAQQGYNQIHLMPIISTPDDALCMYSLEFSSYADRFSDLLDNLEDVQPDDLILIQASDSWQDHFIDHVEQLRPSIFENVATIYVQSTGWTRAIDHPNIQNMDSYDIRILSVIREHLAQEGQIWVVDSNQLPLSYPLATLLANEATLIDSISGEHGEPYAINIYGAK